MALDFVEDHAPKRVLDKIKHWKEADKSFIEVRDCSDEFQTHFLNAWKAIELSSVQAFKNSVEEMKQQATLEKALSQGNKNCLTVYRLIVMTSKHTEKRMCFYMTLLSYAVIKKEKKIIEMLMEDGDPKGNAFNQLTGSILTQTLVYCLHYDCSECIDGNIFQTIVEKYSKSELEAIVWHLLPYGSCEGIIGCFPLELAILNRRLDVAQMMVNQGANPIAVSEEGGIRGVIPLMEEYKEFGTNKYVRWLLYEYLSPNNVNKFIKDVLRLEIFNEGAKELFKRAGRNHAHAILLCGHKQMVKALLEHPDHGGHGLLDEEDAAGYTALKVAADYGDLDSIKILIKMRKDFNVQGVIQDSIQALLIAARKNHLEVISYIFQEVPEILEEVYPGKRVWKAAVAEGLSSVFKVAREYDERILSSTDDDLNTLAHIAVYEGDPELFKVAFLMRTTVTTNPFKILAMKNAKNRTPLEVAVENDQILILKILQNRAIERKSKQTSVHHNEETKWKEFWNEWGPKLVLHACSHGSGSLCIKVLDEMGSPLSFEIKGTTPLSEAARNGKCQIVGYLLERNVRIKMENSQSPLLLAASNGYSRCVQKLLFYHADVSEVDDRGYNCLMKAVLNKHQKTVLVILSDENQGLKALQMYREFTKPVILFNCETSLLVKEYQTPMRLLIEHMPEIAEWVLHRCSLHITTKDFIESENFTDGIPEVAESYEITSDEINQGEDTCEIKGYIMSDKYELLDDNWEQGPGISAKKENRLRDSKHIAITKGLLKKCFCKESDQGEVIEMVDYHHNDQGVSPESEERQKKEFTLGNTTKHPIQLMVKHKREDLLEHPLIQEWIKRNWISHGIPGLATYFVLYVMFLSLLTAFVAVLPRPGLECLSNTTVLMNVSNTSDVLGDDIISSGAFTANENVTVSAATESDFSGADLEQCVGTRSQNFLLVGSIILIAVSLVYLFLEVYQLVLRGSEYLKEPENYFQLCLFFFCLLFVFPVDNTCWCLSSWRWQIGAITSFLSWMNLIFLFKYMPLVGQPAVQLINVYFNFVKLIYLPILLVLAFAFPFYMIFSQSQVKDTTSEALSIYINPWNSLLKVFLQTTGEVDGNAILVESMLDHPITAFVLFIIFIIAVPILFNNFLIGMAVGETEEERKIAKFTRIKAKVDSIFRVKGTLNGKIIKLILGIIFAIVFFATCCFCCFGCCTLLFCDSSSNKETQSEEGVQEKRSAFHEKVKEHIERIKSNNTIEETMQNVMRLDKHVQVTFNGIQTQIEQQQIQTQDKLKQMEEQQAVMKTMLTQIAMTLKKN